MPLVHSRTQLLPFCWLARFCCCFFRSRVVIICATELPQRRTFYTYTSHCLFFFVSCHFFFSFTLPFCFMLRNPSYWSYQGQLLDATFPVMSVSPQTTNTLPECLQTSPTRFRASFLRGCLLVLVLPIILYNELHDRVCLLARALIARSMYST